MITGFGEGRGAKGRRSIILCHKPFARYLILYFFTVE